MTTISQKVELVLGAKDAGAAKGLRNIELGAKAAEKAGAALQSALKGAIGFFAAKFTTEFVGSVVSSGAALSRLGKGIGVSVEDLSRLQYAFELAGLGGEKLRDVLETLEKKRAAALRGSGEQVRGFNALGIDFEQLRDLDAAQLLGEIAEGLRQYGTQQAKVAALTPIFESNLGNLTALLSDGRDGLKAAAAQADAFGITLSTTTAQALERADSGFRRFKVTIDSVAGALTQKGMEALFGRAESGRPDIGSLEATIENAARSMKNLQDRVVRTSEDIAAFTAAGLTWDEVMRISTLSTDRQSEALRVMAERLNAVIVAAKKAESDQAFFLPAGPALPNGPSVPQGFEFQDDASQAARNARFAPPTDNSAQARSVGDPGFVDGLTASWDRLVQTMGTANAVGQQFGNLVGGAISGVSDILVDMIATGESSSEMWKRLGASVASELAKIAIQYAIIGAIKGASGISFAHGGVGGGDGNDEPPMRIHKFAHGGMAGGIAGGASVAVYGETSRREAFVPLQDGRSIPVRIEGSGGSSVQTVYYINAIDTKSMAQALQQHGAIYRGAVRDGLAGQGGDRRIAKRAVR